RREGGLAACDASRNGGRGSGPPQPAYPLPRHLAAQPGELGLQGQLLRAEVVAGQQAHAAEDAVVVADELVEIRIVARIRRVEAETRDLVEADRANEALAHLRG